MKKQSIVMFPFMAQGHIIPLLALALKIEQTRPSIDVIFVNTPLNVQKIRQSIPATSTMRVLEIPFNSSDHGLPPNTENTDTLSIDLVIRFLQASATLKPAFRSLLADLVHAGSPPPICVIADFLFSWSAEVAHELGLLHALFSCISVYGLACFHSVWLNLPHRSTKSPVFTLQDFPEAGEFDVNELWLGVLQAKETDDGLISLQENLREWSETDALLFNSVGEIEEIGSAYLRRIMKRSPIWCVGPLLLPGYLIIGKQAQICRDQCMGWLNSKPPRSVLYISFGTMNTIGASQMMQLAKALEKTNVNFIWVVRPPLGFDINGGFRAEEWLPEGFMKRVIDDEKRGIILTQWAPQVEILSHNSVGGFLTHCGWNSVTEAFRGGVPLLVWPLAPEQSYIAKFLVEIGVAVLVARWASGEIRCEEVVEKIEMVLVDKEMRRKANELKDMTQDAIRFDDDDGDGLKKGFKGSSMKALDEFLDATLSFKAPK